MTHVGPGRAVLQARHELAVAGTAHPREVNSRNEQDLPPIRAVLLTSASSSAAELYLCKSPDRTFWADVHCTHHLATVERTFQVRGGVTHAERVAQAERCLALDRHVARLDEMARQAMSGQAQDWNRGERRRMRDEQVALGC